jgi:type IV secretion system protein VirB5
MNMHSPAPWRGKVRSSGRNLSARTARALCLAAFSFMPAVASAQGIPTLDIQGIIQDTLQNLKLAQQLEQQVKTYEKQVEQLSVALEQRNALLGSRGLAALANGPLERSARRATPPTFEELLRLSEATGVPGAELLRTLFLARQRELNLVPASSLGPAGTANRTAAAYERSRSSALANLAMSEKVYNDSTQRVNTYETFIAQIDRTPDLKASADLQSRIQAENGLLMNELLRVLATNSAASSAQQANELVSRTNLDELGTLDVGRLEALARTLRIGPVASR